MKIIRPGDNPRTRAVRGLSAREKAMQAAIEKQQSRYLRLSCGHYQTLETTTLYAFDVLYSILDRKLQLFCEKCDDFVPPIPRGEKTDLPDNPLF